MDRRLAAWARRVKARRGGGAPPLWLFTDSVRLPDARRAVLALPRGLCGVVLRDGAGVAGLCRRLGLPVTEAGGRGPGVHWRGGHGVRRRGWVTSSAHDGRELMRAARRGADAVFLSPVFPTRSHPGAPALGVLRWAALARPWRGRVWALGGVDGRSCRRLPGWVAGAGGIGALVP